MQNLQRFETFVMEYEKKRKEKHSITYNHIIIYKYKTLLYNIFLYNNEHCGIMMVLICKKNEYENI